MSIVVLPLSAKTLGLDAFALLGMAATFQLVVFVLDGCNFMTRVVAREIGPGTPEAATRSLALFTAAERHYLWLTSLGSAACLLLATPLANRLDSGFGAGDSVLAQSLMLIGVGAFLKLMASFYRGGVIGADAQLRANVIALLANVVRFPGAYISTLVVPDVRLFMGVQLLSFVLEAVALRSTFRRLIPARLDSKQQAEKSIPRSEWRFVANTFGLAAVTALATQFDKVLLAASLSLRDFGAVSLAIMLCGGLYLLATPIHQMYLPRLARSSDTASLAIHDLTTALTATLLVLTLPIAITFGLASSSIARLIASGGDAPTALLADAFLLWGIGNCVAILSSAFYLVYFASGRIGRYSALQLAYLAAYLPLAWLSLRWYGARGAGMAWVAGNLTMLLVLSIALFRLRAIDARVLRILSTSIAVAAVSVALGGIIQPLFPSALIAATGITAVVYLVSLALTSWALIPFIGRQRFL